jgi:hypothetical protein
MPTYQNWLTIEISGIPKCCEYMKPKIEDGEKGEGLPQVIIEAELTTVIYNDSLTPKSNSLDLGRITRRRMMDMPSRGFLAHS